MKHLKSIITILVFAISFSGFSQKVKLDDGFVLIDEVKVLQHVSKSLGMNNTFSDLTGKKLFFVDEVHPNSNMDSWYMKVYFVEADLKMTIKNNTRKGLIKKMIEEEVLSKEGLLNLDNVKIFVSRYDANVEN